MNTQRLLQLAQHLETGKLGHEVFDFSDFNNTKEPKCGTAGCAIGECPILWPEDWIWLNNGEPSIKSVVHLLYSTEIWFDISFDEVMHLFVPYNQDISRFGGRMLSEKSTKEQVAANIRAFVKIKTEQNDNS